MDDLLIDTPIFQEIRKEGFEKGLEEGLEQGLERGLEQGLLLGLRRSIVRRVNRRFPDLTALAQQQVEQMGSEEILNDVLTKIIMAQNQEEAQEILLHWQENIQ